MKALLVSLTLLILTSCTAPTVSSFMGTLSAADAILLVQQQDAIEQGDTDGAAQIANQRQDLAKLREGITAGIAEDGSITPDSALDMIIPFIPHEYQSFLATGGTSALVLTVLMLYLRKRRNK